MDKPKAVKPVSVVKLRKEFLKYIHTYLPKVSEEKIELGWLKFCAKKGIK